MYKFNELEIAQIDITHRCQASCPMCLRNIRGGIDNPELKLTDWTVNDFKTIFNYEVLDQLKVINFCGNFGEPILNNDLIEMCQYVKDSGKTTKLDINTNGSARTPEWWARLAKAMPKNHKVEFAIDGLRQEHSLHRIGTNFEKIIENAKAFIDTGGNAHWMFIEFAHNEHQVEEAQAMAEQLGFSAFKTKHSKRHGNDYKVVDRKGNVSHVINLPKDSQVHVVKKADVDDYLNWPKGTEIKCIVQKQKSIYIDGFFTVVPCCFMAGLPYASFDPEIYKKHGIYDESLVLEASQIAKDATIKIIDEMGGISGLNAATRGLKNIVDSEQWQTIWYNKWKSKESPICMFICSADSPFTSVADQRQRSIEFKKNV